MTDARDTILNKIRKANISQDSLKHVEAEQHLTRHPRGSAPQWRTDNINWLIAKLAEAAGSCSRISHSSELNDTVDNYLSTHYPDSTLTIAPHPLLEGLIWSSDRKISEDIISSQERVTLNVAECAIAETGALMLMSSAQSPTALNFLADCAIYVLESRNIVSYWEDAWDRWRHESGVVPRVINFIAGPSRTADVEQTIQLGAHGPRQLHVILLESGQ